MDKNLNNSEKSIKELSSEKENKSKNKNLKDSSKSFILSYFSWLDSDELKRISNRLSHITEDNKK